MNHRWIIPGAVLIAGALFFVGRRAGAEDDKKSDASARKPAVQRTFVVVYARGENWDKTKPVNQQPGIGDHAQYMVKLFDAGTLKHGGPFLDGSGGMAVFVAADEAAAKRVVAYDPAIKSKVMKQAMLKPWHPVDWTRFPRKPNKPK